MKWTTALGWLFALLACAPCQAARTGAEPLVDPQDRPWHPQPPAIEQPLWPDALAITLPVTTGAERFGRSTRTIAGQPVTMVQLVSRSGVGLNELWGRTLLEHGQQILVFMMLFPRGEPAEAHPAAHGNRLELGEFFLRDRVLDRIKVQKRPRSEE